MKSIKSTLIILAIIILGGSCSHRVDESSLHIVDFTEAIDNVEEVMLSKYVSSLRYTPIETPESALLGRIGWSFFADDSLMCFTSSQMQRCIHIFTRDGKYIKDIGAKGNGPSEYVAVRTMTIIPEDNSLMVEGGYNILFYSLDDGKCIRKCTLHDFFDSSNDLVTPFKGRKHHNYNMKIGNVIFHNNHLYASAGDNTTLDQYLIKMNKDCIVDTMVKVRQTTLGIGIPRVEVSYLYTYNGNVNIVHGLKDTVYAWNDNTLQPRITFDYGNILSMSTMPQIKKTHPFFSPDTRHLNTKVADIIIGAVYIFTESDSFVIGTLFLPKDVVIANDLLPCSHFVYDKHSRTTKLIKYSKELEPGGFTNDIDGGMPFWPTKHIGNKLYQFVDAGTFIEMSKKYNSPRMKEIAATLTEESNPVMIEATLK
jgi:hypothetical protein